MPFPVQAETTVMMDVMIWLLSAIGIVTAAMIILCLVGMAAEGAREMLRLARPAHPTPRAAATPTVGRGTGRRIKWVAGAQ